MRLSRLVCVWVGVGEGGVVRKTQNSYGRISTNFFPPRCIPGREIPTLLLVGSYQDEEITASSVAPTSLEVFALRTQSALLELELFPAFLQAHRWFIAHQHAMRTQRDIVLPILSVCPSLHPMPSVLKITGNSVRRHVSDLLRNRLHWLRVPQIS